MPVSGPLRTCTTTLSTRSESNTTTPIGYTTPPLHKDHTPWHGCSSRTSPSCCSGVGLYQLVCIVTNSNPWARSSLDSGSGRPRKWMLKDLQRSIILNSPSLQVQTRPWCSGLSVSKRAHFIQPTAPFYPPVYFPLGIQHCSSAFLATDSSGWR